MIDHRGWGVRGGRHVNIEDGVVVCVGRRRGGGDPF